MRIVLNLKDLLGILLVLLQHSAPKQIFPHLQKVMYINRQRECQQSLHLHRGPELLVDSLHHIFRLLQSLLPKMAKFNFSKDSRVNFCSPAINQEQSLWQSTALIVSKMCADKGKEHLCHLI